MLYTIFELNSRINEIVQHGLVYFSSEIGRKIAEETRILSHGIWVDDNPIKFQGHILI